MNYRLGYFVDKNCCSIQMSLNNTSSSFVAGGGVLVGFFFLLPFTVSLRKCGLLLSAYWWNSFPNLS